MNLRLVYLVLCLGLVPFAAGCVDNATGNDPNKADEQSKTSEPAKSYSSPSEASKKTLKPNLDFSGLPVNDPLIANAIQAREQIAELEEELLRQLDDLRNALASAKADPDRLRQSAEQFIDITKSMRAKTQQVGDSLNAVSEKTTELIRSSRHLASSYRALAELFRKKARDFGEKKLREQLLDFAKDYDEVATWIPERCKALEAMVKKIPALKTKVKEVNLFLNDAIAFINSHPGLGSEPREKYSTQFESFAETFSEWLRVLDELRKTLRERAVSKVIQDTLRREIIANEKLELAKREESERIEREKRNAAEIAKQKEEARRKSAEQEHLVTISSVRNQAKDNEKSENKQSPISQKQDEPNVIVVDLPSDLSIIVVDFENDPRFKNRIFDPSGRPVAPSPRR